LGMRLAKIRFRLNVFSSKSNRSQILGKQVSKDVARRGTRGPTPFSPNRMLPCTAKT